MGSFTILIFCSLLLLVLPEEGAELTETTTVFTEEGIEEGIEVTTDSIEDEVVEESKIIHTGSGAIRGRRVTRNERTHYEFLGIPYAVPPLGELRFKPPKPVR